MGRKFSSYIPAPGKRVYLAIGLLAFEIFIFTIFAENFLTIKNLSTVLINVSDLAIVSLGMTMLLIMGGIDISAGSALGVVGFMIAQLLFKEVHPIIIAFVAIAAGTLIGLINGLLITKFRIPDIIATLSTNSVFRALIFGLLGGKYLVGIPLKFKRLATGTLFGIPNTLIIIIVFFTVFWLVLTFTRYGRKVYAVGDNTEAAKALGININNIRLATYSIMGALIGFAALLYMGRVAVVEIGIGSDLAIRSIAVAVIGGTSVTGGRGSIIGTIAGALFMAFLKNGLVLLGMPSLAEPAVTGVLILLFVGIDVLADLKSTGKIKSRLLGRRLNIVDNKSKDIL